MDRFNAHLGVVNRRDMKDIGCHFNGLDHSGTSDMTIHVLHPIYALSEAAFILDVQLAVEFKWIHTLRMIYPHALNMKNKTQQSKLCQNILNFMREYCTSEFL